jgi:phosphohistidine phosphatase SixA
LLPGGSPQELLALLARTRGRRVAVIGHQPDLGRLIASSLPGSAGSAAFELRKFALALIAFPGSPRAGQGELRWLVPPKLLRALR